MAKDTTNSIGHYLTVKEIDESDLAPIRKWKNLKVATEGELIWVSNFEDVQITSVEVKSIPNKSIYYSENGKLYPQNGLLPEGNEPSLLWTPIRRAFPLKLTNYNHNFFGVDEKISISIIKSDKPRDSKAMIIDMDSFKLYIETTSAIRLKNMEWVILNNTEVLVFGAPLLPLNGEAYWKKQGHFLPIGYDFELYELSNLVSKKIDPENLNWIIWNKDSNYFKVEKAVVQSLTIGSVRKSIGFKEDSFSRLDDE